MNLERTLKQGQLATAEQEARALAIRIHGLKRELRLYLAEHESPEELEASRVQQLSEDLTRAHMDYEARLKTIASLREDLGLPRYEIR